MQGLTTENVNSLQKEHGFNRLTGSKKRSFFIKFFGQLNNFLIYLLLIAAILAFLVGERVESVLILVIVGLNAFIGIYQEGKAEEAVELLQNMAKSFVRVIRDGREQEIDSTLLVPGDIVYLEEGTKVPADAIVLDAKALELNESILTGESLSVPKEKGEQVFMGTVLAKGNGHFRIEKIGMRTKFGSITEHLSQVEKVKTPLQLKLESLSRLIGMIGIAASIIVFGISFYQGQGAYLSFLLAISLAVAIVPEGLPAIMTVTLSIGVKEMAKRKAIVRKLSAVEALGNITLIATDKTGTLTTNNMRVKDIFVEKEEDKNLLLLNGILCSTASLVKIHDHGSYDILGDPTEGALLLYAQENGVDVEQARKEWKIVDEEPFDALTKLMMVKAEKGTKQLTFVKGAPEAVLKGKYSKAMGQKIEEWTKKGYRVMGFAEDKTYLGAIALYDPPRPEVKEAIERARSAGIEVVMITGDNPRTAESIGAQVGLLREGEEILIGTQIDDFSDEELMEKIKKTRIFARTNPLQKSRIVMLYQKLGEIVAVTGDGVNDAVALKQANVGIAMGVIGTDVARETADIVLSDDNFATIVSAIEQGRGIVKKLSNTVKYLFTTNLTEAASLILGMILGLPLLFYPLQLLYINLISDGLPAIALAFSPSDKNIMKNKPEKSVSLLSRFDTIFMLVIGLTGAVIVVGAYYLFFYGGLSFAKTAAFSVLAMIQSYVFAEIWLSHRAVWKHISLLNSKIFFAAFLSPFVLQIALLNIPGLARIFNLHPVNAGEFLWFIALSASVTMGIWLLKLIQKPS